MNTICNSIYITFLIISFAKSVYGSNENIIKSLTIEDKLLLPTYKDLPDYLNSLERIIDFWSHLQHKLNLNSIFGLFLVNVNLRPLLNDGSLSKPVQYHINKLIITIDKLQKQYEDIVLRDTDSREDNHQKDVKIVRLFTESSWSNKLRKFDDKLILRHVSQYEPVYADWDSYQRKVDSLDKWMPSPRLSDACIVSLSKNEPDLSKHKVNCKLPTDCYYSQVFGTNFGYALTHRLLLLQLADFGRGCTIFSTDQDERLRHYFCGIIYREAEYNAFNGFNIVDLMFEQIALCSLEGHVQFLRKPWMSRLLKYQTHKGCFSQTISKPKGTFEKFPKESYNKDVCNDHVTAVAAAALAGAIRYILENY